MNKFWELYERNAVISGALALILVLGCVVMAVMQIPVPQFLIALASGACGYFFGAGKAAATVAVITGKGKCC